MGRWPTSKACPELDSGIPRMPHRAIYKSDSVPLSLLGVGTEGPVNSLP